MICWLLIFPPKIALVTSIFITSQQDNDKKIIRNSKHGKSERKNISSVRHHETLPDTPNETVIRYLCEYFHEARSEDSPTGGEAHEILLFENLKADVSLSSLCPPKIQDIKSAQKLVQD